MYSFLKWSLIFCLFVPNLSLAQSDAKPISLVVVPSKTRGAKNLAGPIRKYIEKPLKKEFGIFPFAKYKKAGRKVGVKGKNIFLPSSVTAAGGEAGVKYVLIAESQMEKIDAGKRKKKAFFLNIAVIEVTSGDTAFSSRYPLPKKKIDRVLGKQILVDIINGVNNHRLPPEPPAEDTSSEAETLTPPPPPPGVPVSEIAAGEDTTLASNTMDIPPSQEIDENAGYEEAVAPVPPDRVKEESTEEPSIPKLKIRNRRARPGLAINLGPFGASRTASIKGKSFSGAASRPPRYKGPLPGFCLRADVFPLAIGGKGEWFEGFGLHLESQFMYVKTIVEEVTKAAVTSNVLGANGGLSFRYVLWNSFTAMDLTVKIGYAMFLFPLADGVFPGVRYQSPYAGGQINIPIVKQFGIILGGHYAPMVSISGKLKKLGKIKKAKPAAYRVDGGLRLFFDPVEITVLGRLEQYNAAFTGVTKLAGLEVNQQFQNVKLQDRYIGGLLTAGVAF